MEHNLGVGVIVGLTFASSAYIWNSDKFTKEQKTILLIFVVFPPAQWLAILLVLAYNSSRDNNTIERKTEKKLDTTIANLTDLKQKGIITENEYKEKIFKIEAEKAEQYLKNSTEYKQLKNLFDSDVLTKDEFESKIQLLQKSLDKVTNKTKTVFRETTNNQILKIVSEPTQTIGADVFINYTKLHLKEFTTINPELIN